MNNETISTNKNINSTREQNLAGKIEELEAKGYNQAELAGMMSKALHYGALAVVDIEWLTSDEFGIDYDSLIEAQWVLEDCRVTILALDNLQARFPMPQSMAKKLVSVAQEYADAGDPLADDEG